MSLKKSGFTDYEYTLYSGDSGKTLTFNLDPVPDLISVSGIPSSATIGSPFTITMSAKNKGNVSDEGSIHAALRFSDWGGQSLSERRDDLDVAIVANTWATGYLNWRPNDNKTCYEKNGGTHSPIRENFIEAYDAPWPATTEQQATFTVTPRRTGTLYVLVRTTMQKADDAWVNDISADTSKPSDLDEQGWTCRLYTIPVGEVQGQIDLDIRDADRNRLQSDVNAVQLWGNNGLIKRWDPPNSNPIQAGSYTYGDYYADVYAWDMWISQKHFTLNSSYMNVECQASIRKRSLEITALSDNGPVQGVTIYLDSWNGEYKTWSERAYGTSGSDGKVTFSAWPTVPASQSYRVRAYWQGNWVGAASDIKVDANNGGSSVVQCLLNLTSPGTLQFAEVDRTKTVEEGIGSLSFYVVRQDGVDGSAAVHYEIGGGTAVGGTDYSASQYSGDLTWNNGDGDVKPIPVTILNPDSQIKDARTFNITLSQTSGQGGTLGAFRTAAVTITDDDKPSSGVIHFDASSYNYHDNTLPGLLYCKVQRSNGKYGLARVKWSTKQLQGEDAAVEGQDYEKTEGTLEWADGDDSERLFGRIKILNNVFDVLSAKQFAVELTADTTDTVLGSPTNATAYIVNQKAQMGGIIEFDKSAYWANDTDGQVQINVQRRSEPEIKRFENYRRRNRQRNQQGFICQWCFYPAI